MMPKFSVHLIPMPTIFSAQDRACALHLPIFFVASVGQGLCPLPTIFSAQDRACALLCF